MQHYLLRSLENDIVHFDIDDHHHIRSVMRFSSGDEVIGIYDHTAYRIRLEISAKDVIGYRLETLQHALPSREIILIYGLPKADKWELVLQKATELGVTQIIPFESQKSLVKIDSKSAPAKYERWQRIIKEAVEQSERLSVPVLHPIRHQLQFDDVQGDIKLFAYERSTSPSLLDILRSSTGDVVMVVGPEAGWAPHEAAYFEKIGYTIVSLGTTILRSETAALYMLAATKLVGDSHD